MISAEYAAANPNAKGGNVSKVAILRDIRTAVIATESATNKATAHGTVLMR